MQTANPLIRTKLHLPFTRAGIVSRPRLDAQLAHGLQGPLTLITASAGFGKTTLVASYAASCGLPIAWLSLDKDDNQAARFLNYLVAALQEADQTIGSEAHHLLAAARQVPPEAVLTSLINDLEASGKEIVLVLDDYQQISSPAVHEAATFLLEHCPKNFHLVITTRSDPPLPLTRFRTRGQAMEIRAHELSFTEPEATQFLNESMGLELDARSVAALEERTEGWIAGLQMAALSMHNRKDVYEFIEGFSGTNRYILDYLLEEVLANQPAEIQHFLLYTSILERLAAPLCEALLGDQGIGDREFEAERSSPIPYPLSPHPACQQILEYLERTNLFLVPLDDERLWYRYHHLFADLLRAQLQKKLGTQGVDRLHLLAAEWLGQNGSILEAIDHASLAQDDERVERFIEQNYREIISRGEQSSMRYWTSKLSKELVYRRPWLCIYEAHSHAWFGELDEADRLLEAAEKLIRSEISVPDARTMLGHFSYVKSRVTAMRGDMQRAIEYCLAARENIPTDNLSLQFNTLVTLGYEYFLMGDYANASQVLNEAIRLGISAGALMYTVAATCFMARLYAVQGLLRKSYDTYQMAEKLILEASGEHRDARALLDIGLADLFCEWNDLEPALIHLQRGLALLHLWGKADDLILAYITLARIHLAQGNKSDARVAIEKAVQVVQTSGVFSEAQQGVEIAQVKLWLNQGEFQAANRWIAAKQERLGSDDRFRFENELASIARARVWIAQNQPDEAIGLLSHLEEIAQTAGRMGRVIEILLLEAFALREMNDSEQAQLALTKCLTLAQPEGYVRIFLDEGQPMQYLLARWLAHAGAGPLRDYASRLLSLFCVEPKPHPIAQEKASPTGNLVEPLSQRELEVLHLMSLGTTNQEIARRLIVAPGTVKAHAASIYRKLDVANRTEAVARARQLGILP